MRYLMRRCNVAPNARSHKISVEQRLPFRAGVTRLSARASLLSTPDKWQMASEQVQLPTDKRALRACLLCSLIKNQNQFKRDGCDNCEEILNMKGASDRVLDCTSQNFDGVIALMNPDRSWTAKWQRIEPYVKGLYAVRVVGRVPEDVEDELDRRNMRYRPRDGSVKD